VRPRGTVQPADEKRILKALAAREAADQAVRDAVLAAAENGASVRELGKIPGLSPSTVDRWKTGG